MSFPFIAILNGLTKHQIRSNCFGKHRSKYKTTYWDFFGDSGVVINVANIVHDHGDYNDSARKITTTNGPIPKIIKANREMIVEDIFNIKMVGVKKNGECY